MVWLAKWFHMKDVDGVLLYFQAMGIISMVRQNNNVFKTEKQIQLKKKCFFFSIKCLFRKFITEEGKSSNPKIGNDSKWALKDDNHIYNVTKKFNK